MKNYQFVSKNGIEVTIDATGSYNDGGARDLSVETSDGFYREFEECMDGHEVIDALEESGVEFDENPRFANEYIINACIIQEESTLDEALDFIARREARQA